MMTVPLIVATSAVATTISAPVIRWILTRSGILDFPNHRSSHSTPVPRAGGLACLVGLVGGVVVADAKGVALSWPAIAAAVFLCGVGFFDDVRSLPALPRLVMQVLAGGA